MEDLRRRLDGLRAEAAQERDPTTSDDVLAALLKECARVSARRVLEVGTGRGLTAVALLLGGVASVVTVERDGGRIAAAKENFAAFGVS